MSESLLIEAIEVIEQWSKSPGSRAELGVEVGGCATRPRADLLADIAACHHDADLAVQGAGYVGPVLHREVANAATRIKNARRRKGTRRTGVEARRAAAAMAACRGVRCELDVGQQDANEEL